MGEPKEPDLKSLIQVPLEVVRKLEDPLLLTGIGAAAVCAIIAIFAPGDKSIYVWPIAGLILAVCIISAIVGAVRDRSGSQGTTIKATNKNKASRGSTIDGSGIAINVNEVPRAAAAAALAKPTPEKPAAEKPAPEKPATPRPREPITPEALPHYEFPEGEGVTERGVFIGRRVEIDAVLNLLGQRHEGTVFDVSGMHGVGKTLLLKQICDEAAERPNVIVRTIQMADIVDGYQHDHGDAATVGVLDHTFAVSGNLMRTLVTDTGWDFNRVWSHFDRQKKIVEVNVKSHNRIRASRKSTVQNSGTNIVVNVPELQNNVRAAQADVDQAFVDAWVASVKPDVQVLVAIDSFERCADDELGHWIVRMAMRLPNLTVVVARLATGHRLPSAERVQEVQLANFTMDEVSEYLARRLLLPAADPDVVQVVYDFTEGHPGGVLLVGGLIEGRSEAMTAATLRPILSRILTDSPQAWGILVDAIVTKHANQQAVRAAAVASSVDHNMMTALLTVPGTDADYGAMASDAISTLYNLGLFLEIQMPDGNPRYRMHEFIRQSVGNRLRTEDPPTWQRLHGNAAAFLFATMQEGEDGEDETAVVFGLSGSYGGWYKYEHPTWQWLKRQWLYHTGQLTERRTLTRTQFAWVFFDAFWWWGCYLNFDFNRQLVDDWERSAAAWRPQAPATDPERRRDALFGQALLEFLTYYPTGYIKPPTASWEEIGNGLLLVRDLCDLDRSRPTDTEAQIEAADNARALISIFLAHSARFAIPRDLGAQGKAGRRYDDEEADADRYYQEARAGFVELEDPWTAAWMDLECADLALERGNLDEIAPLLAESAAAIREIGLGEDGEGGEWDHEAIANLHRIQADMAWQLASWEEAARGYGRALASAYWFQGDPHQPDAYTQQYYDEITTRIGQRIIELNRHDPQSAVDFVLMVKDEFSEPGKPTADEIRALIATGDYRAVADGLFPPGPTNDELVTDPIASPFMGRWRRARQRARLKPEDSLVPLLAAASEDAG